MKLRDARTEILELLKEQLSIIAGGYPAAKLGEVFEDVAKCFQAIGCANLLISADAEGFHRNLIWAGFTRRHFLNRSLAERSADDFHLARSRCESFFCTIAAGDILLAREIGDLSAQRWLPDGEYEDDFSYHLFLSLVINGSDAPACASALERLEGSLRGAPPTRLDICRAIHARSSADFEAAFGALLDAHLQWVEEGRSLFSDDVTFAPRSYVFVEGLALMRLAEQLQIGPREREYPLCPSIARVNPLRARPDDLLVEIEQTMRGQRGP